MATMTLADGSTVQYSAIRKMIATPDKISGGEWSADAQVDREVKALQVSTGRTYADCLSSVMTTRPALKKAWLAQSRGRK